MNRVAARSRMTRVVAEKGLDTDAEEDAVAELHAKVAATSPVGQTLSKAIPVEISPA